MHCFFLKFSLYQLFLLRYILWSKIHTLSYSIVLGVLQIHSHITRTKIKIQKNSVNSKNSTILLYSYHSLFPQPLTIINPPSVSTVGWYFPRHHVYRSLLGLASFIYLNVYEIHPHCWVYSFLLLSGILYYDVPQFVYPLIC